MDKVEGQDWSWTQERVDFLREHWLAGKSAGEVGRMLGVSRNAVIGKVHRLGITRTAEANAISMAKSRLVVPGHMIPISRCAQELGVTAKTIRMWAKRKGVGHQWFGALHLTREILDQFRAERAQLRTNVIELAVAEPLKAKPRPTPPVHEGRKVTLMELGRCECRFPVNAPSHGGEYLFCGEATAPGRVYCTHHHAKTFLPYIGRVLPPATAAMRRRA